MLYFILLSPLLTILPLCALQKTECLEESTDESEVRWVVQEPEDFLSPHDPVLVLPRGDWGAKGST